MPYISATPPLSSPESCILVPLDGSAASARQYDRDLLLVRASTPPAYDTGTETYIPSADYAMSYRWEAEEYVEEVASRIRNHGLRARTLVISGPPEAELVALSARKPIGIVILSTHGRSGAARLLLGSVARHLIYHATTPLIVLPPRYLAMRGAPLTPQQASAR
jgi:nucleotide-binding universal stress UspA family protein